MNKRRRHFLAAAAGTGALAAAGLLATSPARAAAWNKAGFESKALNDALKNLGAANAVESRDITITAPDIAENGAVVPVAVTSRIPNTQSISLIAEKNPFPLAATFDVANGAEPYASVRIKMGQTSNVRAIVKADGKFYTAAKEVKVTVGGCG
ncbi:MAG TPA: thiosulfate oxidation carrier protein SoxY [Burkholderiales bacterium]|nr:thiosulfate oxidation carrier protein SoxY [Burkholderiales bacterium]